MHKLRAKSYICIIILLLGSNIVNAQGLKIGDKCPPELSQAINRLLSKSAYSQNLPKPVLIDFWATWCSPCVAALPKLDSMQKKHSTNFTILSILEKSDTRVREVLERVFGKKGSTLTFIEGEPIFNKFFPHQTIPHYIWISRDRVIRAITADEMTISKNVEKLLASDNSVTIDTKPTLLPYDGDRPMFAGGQATIGNELEYHSIVTKWRPDLGAECARGDNFIDCINSSILWLYQIAFGKFDLKFLDVNRVELIGFKSLPDSANIGLFHTDSLKKIWRQEQHDKLYSYELRVPPNTHSFDELFQIMQQDMNRYFKTKGISGHLEEKPRKVLSLQLISKAPSAAFKKTDDKPGHYVSGSFLKMVNEPMPFFLNQLTPLLKGSSLTLVNETGYNDVVNIELNDAKDLASINKCLAANGLLLKEAVVNIPVLVIKKNK